MVKQEAEDPSDDADRGKKHQCLQFLAKLASSNGFWSRFVVFPPTDFLPIVAQELASMVALSGDQLEELARARNVGEEELA